MIIPLDFTSKALIKKRGVLIALLHLYFILPVQLAKREVSKFRAFATRAAAPILYFLFFCVPLPPSSAD